MDSEYKVKQITKLYKSCDTCGLPNINCICSIVPKVKTNIKIWILSTEKEFHRPSNTARLLKLVNPESTEIFLWERTKAPNKLMEYINSEIYETYLLFPIENDHLLEREVEFKNSEKIKAFVILDGTWKEARKMLRTSDYLKRLPGISLTPGLRSEYDLRKGAAEGELCTIEAAMEILKINHEAEEAHLIRNAFCLFIKSFKAGVNGQKVKE